MLAISDCVITSVMWKSMVKNQYPDKKSYASYMAKVSRYLEGMLIYIYLDDDVLIVMILNI